MEFSLELNFWVPFGHPEPAKALEIPVPVLNWKIGSNTFIGKNTKYFTWHIEAVGSESVFVE